MLHSLRPATLAALLVVFLTRTALGAAGDLDPTFGVGGVAFSDVDGNDGPAAIALQRDGKIVVAGGTSRPEVGVSTMVTRFTGDGDVDRSFGTDGLVEFTFGQLLSAHSVVIQPDARIVLGGTASTTGYADVLLARLERDGSFDSTFGELGIATADLGNTIDTVTRVVLQPDGKVLTIGSLRPLPPPFRHALAVARFLPDGALDPAFGGTGWTSTRVGEFPVGVDGEVLEDGRILVGGQTLIDGDYRRLLVRYQPDGSLDPSFGTEGILTWHDSGSEGLRSVRLVPGGGFTVLGSSPTLPANPMFLLLTRHLADGGFDPGFGTAGSVRLQMQIDEAVLGMAEAPDGKLVVLGRTMVGGRAAFLVMRFLPDGSLDESFGVDGRAVTAFPDHAYPTSVVVQPDGKIVAVGSTGASTRDTVLVRYQGASAECGNGLIESGEECDAGATSDGSCCDALCTIRGVGEVCRPSRSPDCDVAEVCSGTSATCPADAVVPAGATCAEDGWPCTSDLCNGTGICVHADLPDADEDGLCDGEDPCTNPGGARSFLPQPRPLVQVDPRLPGGPGTGRSSVTIVAEILLPQDKPFSTLDPARSGLEIRLADAAGTATSIVLPAEASAPGTRRGWRRSVNGASWVYSDRTPAPVGGVKKVTLAARGAADSRQMSLRIVGRGGEYAVSPEHLPIHVVLLLGDATCAESAFSVEHCTVLRAGERLRCRG